MSQMQKTSRPSNAPPSDRALSRPGEGERRLREIASGSSPTVRDGRELGRELVAAYSVGRPDAETSRVKALASTLGIELTEETPMGESPNTRFVYATIARNPKSA